MPEGSSVQSGRSRAGAPEDEYARYDYPDRCFDSPTLESHSTRVTHYQGPKEITMPPGIAVRQVTGVNAEEVLRPEALEFVADLQRRFNGTRLELLKLRTERQSAFDRGQRPDFLPETRDVRRGAWCVADTPHDLLDRRVEITGPVDRKMMINALNSGAKVFMADLEDSLSPTWSNVIQGQKNLRDAVRKTIEIEDCERGKTYRLGTDNATLVVRPRGWHFTEKHVLVDGAPISASLFDFGLYFFHNAKELTGRGSGPYFYLPKLEGHLEARLWNDVFAYAQERLGITRGTIRATVLIETVLAALEMDEILYELREHSAGLNAGRWDYIFSFIKKFRSDPGMILPDRSQVTMSVPFMNAYTDLLVRTCHRRGAHAIGGMAAFVPNRRGDPAVNEVAFRKVREDKELEANKGFDGTWVAHPDLVPIAAEVFDSVLSDRPNQREVTRDEVAVTAKELLETVINGAQVTEAGVRNNVSVALQYIAAWLSGNGAAAIFNLMEDAATAEISRAQLWQWVRNAVVLDDGRKVDAALYRSIRDEEFAVLEAIDQLKAASDVLDRLVLDEEFAPFLTVPAYELLE
jgi:malate synthase